MNAVARHELVGIDSRGELCACGDRSTHWADHLYLISLEALHEEPAVIEKVRAALIEERAADCGVVLEEPRKRRRCPAECLIIAELRRVRRNERRRTRHAARYRDPAIRGTTAA